MPPIFSGEFATKVAGTTSGRIVLLGVLICLAGIGVAGAAGVSKEREMTDEQKQRSIREFNFKKGVLLATFSGIMSACFAYGLAAGKDIQSITLAHGTAVLWQGLPVLVVVLLGGFTTNFIWCVLLNVNNQTGYQYLSSTVRGPVPSRLEETIIETAFDAPSEEVVEHMPGARRQTGRVPLLTNYLLFALAGVTWYMQFFFYTMGETQMGSYKFSSWSLHMASIIIFSSLWGIALSEWKGSSRRTLALLTLSLAVLVGSTVVIGYGNYLGESPTSSCSLWKQTFPKAGFILLALARPPQKALHLAPLSLWPQEIVFQPSKLALTPAPRPTATSRPSSRSSPITSLRSSSRMTTQIVYRAMFAAVLILLRRADRHSALGRRRRGRVFGV